MEHIALVTGADANYYPLVREWIHSVRRFAESKDCDICVIDAGLSDAQRAELKSLGAKAVPPEWPADLPESRTKGKEFLKACVCRPSIPTIFPGYDIYMWMDADTWVQSWSGVEMFLRSAREKPDRLAVTPQTDRAYERATRVKWLWRWPWKSNTFYFSNARKPFGFKTARALHPFHTLNAGCFALNAKAPHWTRWPEIAREAMTKGSMFTAEQLSMGILVHLEGYKAELLPVYTHWMCSTAPAYDEERKLFVEPYLPHEPLGVMHLSGVDAMRADRKLTTPYTTLTGKTVHLNLRYPYFDGGVVQNGAPAR
jgi:hypothetical protein